MGLFWGASLPAEPSSIRQARQLAVTALADWQLPGLVDDVCVCVSELVGNAIRHTGGAAGSMVRVSLCLVDRLLSVHVQDGNSRPPVLGRQPQLEETGVPDWDDVDALPESGRGLHLVENLASGWSWSPLPVGKVVTCSFDLAGNAP